MNNSKLINSINAVNIDSNTYLLQIFRHIIKHKGNIQNNKMKIYRVRTQDQKHNSSLSKSIKYKTDKNNKLKDEKMRKCRKCLFKQYSNKKTKIKNSG